MEYSVAFDLKVGSKSSTIKSTSLVNGSQLRHFLSESPMARLKTIMELSIHLHSILSSLRLSEGFTVQSTLSRLCRGRPVNLFKQIFSGFRTTKRLTITRCSYRTNC